MGCGSSKSTNISTVSLRKHKKNNDVAREKHSGLSEESTEIKGLVKELEAKLADSEKRRCELEVKVQELTEILNQNNNQKLRLYGARTADSSPIDQQTDLFSRETSRGTTADATEGVWDCKDTVVQDELKNEHSESQKLENDYTYQEKIQEDKSVNESLQMKVGKEQTSEDTNNANNSNIILNDETHTGKETISFNEKETPFDKSKLGKQDQESEKLQAELTDEEKGRDDIHNDDTTEHPAKKTSTDNTQDTSTSLSETKCIETEICHGESKDALDQPQPEILEPKPPALSKEDLLTNLEQFSKVDQHAKQAPEGLRSSIQDLVEYLKNTSQDHLYLVRSFFVWIAINVRYDTEGFFGRSEKSACDFQSVMKSGLSVCEGYANVMEAMCKNVGIPVRKISGFAKGFGHSADKPYTTQHQTNHAWNAVYIKGNWFLLDSTWGAGHLDKNHEFKAEFNEFYFLCDPGKFIMSHFPFMNDNMEESMKWQLLKRPTSLEQFNTALYIKPTAFEIGVIPGSHKQSVINFDDEVELTFEQRHKNENVYSSTLYKKTGNMLMEEQFSTYIYVEDGMLRVKVKPQTSGHYQLELFGRKQSSDARDHLSELFEYSLHCTVPATDSELRKFPYPKAYTQALVDECQVLEPLGKQIPPNSEIKMRFKSPVLTRMMIFRKMLKRNGNTFEGTINTPEKNYIIGVFGSRLDSGSLDGQFQFCVG